ncbi:MAG: metallophosphoesterase [Candidatus Limivicinus sp.]
MTKRMLILWLALVLLLSGCAGVGERGGELELITATDLHYLAPALTDQWEFFTQMLAAADGKVTYYCEELVEAFLAEVTAQKPDALILTGDLSFNGAVESHKALAEKLAAVEAAGVPVYVLPGNHDVYNHYAARFQGDGYELVEAATAEDFARIYADFGFDEALARDGDSISYVAQLNKETRLLMLDTNTLEKPCGLSKGTLAWVEEQLADAQAAGQRVIAAGHQNLYQQTVFNFWYVIGQGEALAALLRQYGVEVFLSGHLHTQHMMTVDGLTEIISSSLAVTPCQYGLLRLEKGVYRYETQPVDVAAWARNQGLTDETLLNFADYARDYFDQCTVNKIGQQTNFDGFSQEQKEAMLDYACLVNRAYFSGDLREAANADPDGSLQRLWDDSGTRMGAYFATFREELGLDYTHWQSGE